MAFVGVLPEQESFGTKVARGLGGGLGAGLNQALQFAQQMQLQREKSRPLQALLGSMTGEAKEGASGSFKPLAPQQEAVLALSDPNAFRAYEALKGSYQKEEEKKVAHQDVTNVLNNLTDTLKGGRLGYTAKRVTAEGRRDAQYFDSLAVQLESIAKDMVSKGVLARDRFAYLLSNLPSSGKTDAANAGALEAWSDELKVPRPEGLESLYKKEKKSPKAQKETKSVRMMKDGEMYDIPEHLIGQAKAQGFSKS